MARTLASSVLMIACTVGAAYIAYHAYFQAAFFIDGFTYMPLIEGSAPPVFWQPRTTGGQVLGWALAALIIAPVLGLDGWMIRRSLRV